MQNEATKTTDNVTWLCPDCRTVTVDMADVTALQAAYDALKAENEQLSRILENTRTQRDAAYVERAELEFSKAQLVAQAAQHYTDMEKIRVQLNSAYNERGMYAKLYHDARVERATAQEQIVQLQAGVSEMENEIEQDAALMLQANSRIAALAEQLQAAQQWKPMNNEIYRDGLVKVLLHKNQMQVNFDDSKPIMIYLDDDIRLCRKVQP